MEEELQSNGKREVGFVYIDIRDVLQNPAQSSYTRIIKVLKNKW